MCVEIKFLLNACQSKIGVNTAFHEIGPEDKSEFHVIFYVLIHFIWKQNHKKNCFQNMPLVGI